MTTPNYDYSNVLRGLAGDAANLDTSLRQSAMASRTKSGIGSFFGSLGSSLAGGLTGGIGSVLGGILSLIGQKRAEKRQFEYNTKLMNMQNEMQRAMLSDEMSLKMQGYKKAGLSTASLAGNFGGNVAVPSAPSVQQGSTNPFADLGSVMNAARAIKLQEKALESEINLNNANAAAANANAARTNVDTGLEQKFGYDTRLQNLANMKVSADELLKRIDVEEEQRKTYKYQRDNVMRSQAIANYAQAYASEKGINLEIDKFDPLTQLWLSQRYYNYHAGNNQQAAANRSNDLLGGDLTLQKQEIEKGDWAIKHMKQQYRMNDELIKNMIILREKIKAETNVLRKEALEKAFNLRVKKILGPEHFARKSRVEYFNMMLDAAFKIMPIVGNVYGAG